MAESIESSPTGGAELLDNLTATIAHCAPSCCSEERQAILEVCVFSVLEGAASEKMPLSAAKNICSNMLDSMWDKLTSAERQELVLAVSRISAQVLMGDNARETMEALAESAASSDNFAEAPISPDFLRQPLFLSLLEAAKLNYKE